MWINQCHNLRIGTAGLRIHKKTAQQKNLATLSGDGPGVMIAADDRRRFPPPWSVEEPDAYLWCHSGQKLAYL
jgi:hypothetical protein